MPLIKPRTRGKEFVQHRSRLDRQNHETLHAYAAFIGEDPDYVLNELIDGVLAKDKDFVKWRTDHPESFAPRALPARSTDHGEDAASRPPAVALRSSTPASSRGGL